MANSKRAIASQASIKRTGIFKDAAIRQAMADMRKDRVIKDTENKAFYEKQQKEHNENSRKILNSIFWFFAIGSGVGLGVYYGRPMLISDIV